MSLWGVKCLFTPPLLKMRVMHKVEHFLSSIDSINEWGGRIFCFLIIPIIGIVVWEVVLRYIFNSPTVWAHETSTFIFGAHFTLGGAYTFLRGGHVNVDIIYGRFSPRTRSIIDLITSTLFFFFCGLMLWKGVEFAWASILEREASNTVWGPPLYPLKTVIPVAAFLLLLQGLAKFIRDFLTVVRRR